MTTETSNWSAIIEKFHTEIRIEQHGPFVVLRVGDLHVAGRHGSRTQHLIGPIAPGERLDRVRTPWQVHSEREPKTNSSLRREGDASDGGVRHEYLSASLQCSNPYSNVIKGITVLPRDAG